MPIASSCWRRGCRPGAPACRATPAPHRRRAHRQREPPDAPDGSRRPGAARDLPPLELEQLQDAWQRGVLDAVRTRSIPIATLLGEARPVELEADTLTIEFAAAAGFHRSQVEEPKNIALLRDALYEVTGRRLTVQTAVGSGTEHAVRADDEPMSEEDVISLLKDTFDAEEVEEH